jgi:hypothetical protein
MKSLRALTMYDHIPTGCVLQPVTNDDSAPHLRPGEFAVIDTTDTAPQHGEVYLIRWLSGRTSIVQLLSRPFNDPEKGMRIGWWTRCLNFEPYDEALAKTRRGSPAAILSISHRATTDGPRVADVIQQSLIGRVIGVYEAAQETLKIAGGRP